MSTPHVAIAGAGLAGRLTAWRLARRGWRVSLFDAGARGDTQSASAVAAAMLSPLAEQTGADGWVFDLGLRSMALWPQWVRELHEDSGQLVYLRRNGTMVVAHAQDAGSFQQFIGLLQRKLPPAYRTRLWMLDDQRLRAMEPALAERFERGLLLEGEGQIANDQLLRALDAALDSLGVVWHEHFEVRTLSATALMGPRDQCEADLVIDARGVGAKADWQALRGVRGEVLVVECPGVRLSRPVRLMHPRYQLYVVPRPHQRFIVGATELESEDRGPTTVRSLLELGSALYSLHPAFSEARVLHSAAALRPALDDHRPAYRQQQGVWQINGLYRHGYLCGPALVERLVRELTGETTPALHEDEDALEELPHEVAS
jgi:glycine oxidase